MREVGVGGGGDIRLMSTTSGNHTRVCVCRGHVLMFLLGWRFLHPHSHTLTGVPIRTGDEIQQQI